MNKDEDINSTYIGARDGVREFTETINIVPLTGRYAGYGFYKDGGYFKRDDAGKWHIISDLPEFEDDGDNVEQRIKDAHEAGFKKGVKLGQMILKQNILVSKLRDSIAENDADESLKLTQIENTMSSINKAKAELEMKLTAAENNANPNN